MKLWRKYILRILPVKRIVDHSRRRQTPERLPQHLVYTILCGAAVVASLWQYAQPQLTFAVLGLIPVLALLAYVPYRVIPSWWRFMIQLAVVAAAAVWLMYRLTHGIPADKVLSEVLAITSLIFLMAQNARDYGYLFAISMILLAYGALLPRTVYLWCLGVAFGSMLILLYSNRLQQLSANPRLPNPRRILRRNWHILALHLGLVAGCFALIFPLFPTDPSGSKGIFAVAFNTDKSSMLPANLQQWFQSEKVKQEQGGIRIIRNGTPDTLEAGGTPMKIKGKQPDSSSQDGSGSAPPGRDLVLRVKSPLKLYHLAQLYDEYDGTRWLASAELKRGRINVRSSERSASRMVSSRYTILKWLSPKLYAPYRPVSFERNNDTAPYSLLRTTFYNSELASNNYPNLPFSYLVSSEISTELENPLSERTRRRWRERPARAHYLKLPEKKISERLKKKVEELTRNAKNDYEKALILRDYLRNNFKYQQYSRPVPEGKETVDYFVFELKEGHCEYFAASLAVMARLAGLPSRTAAGFSPGDFNTLQNVFEVYEYHAHAWTQIFVPEYGWLTMDATPPGEIRSQTTPIGIGKLRDPFGDEWRVTPPELTEHTLQTLKDMYLKQVRAEETPSKAAEIIMQVAEVQEEIRKQIKETYRKVAPKSANRASDKKKTRGEAAWEYLKQLGSRSQHYLRTGQEFLRRYYPAVVLAGAALIAAYVLLRKQLRLRRLHRQEEEAKACFEKAAAALKAGEYRESVLFGYQAIRIELTLAGVPRRRNEELLDYARMLADFREGFDRRMTTVVLAFYEAEYGTGEVSRRSAVLVQRNIRAMRRGLRVPKQP